MYISLMIVQHGNSNITNYAFMTISNDTLSFIETVELSFEEGIRMANKLAEKLHKKMTSTYEPEPIPRVIYKIDNLSSSKRL